MTFAINPDVRAAVAELSPTGVDFLTAMASQTEPMDPGVRLWLDQLGKEIGYRLHSWPVFIDRQVARRMGQLNTRLCNLVRSIPRRVFGLDKAKLVDFYGIEPIHAELVAVAMANPRWVDNTLARTDFLYTEKGFRCLEINMVGNIGGLHCDLWGPQLLADEHFSSFVAAHGARLTPSPLTDSLLRHLLRQALARYRVAEVHMRIVVPGPRASHPPKLPEMLREICERFDTVLEPLGGKIKGTLDTCGAEDLTLRDGMVYDGDHRVLAVLEGTGSLGSSADIYSAWLRGKIDLYNGPATPVLADKQNLAVLSELAGTSLFDDEERQLIADLIPWTRRVSRSPLHPEASPIERSELLARQHELVLKPGGGYAGYGIVLGPSASPEEWCEAIDTAFEQGRWVAQEVIRSKPILMSAGSEVVEHDVVWAFQINGQSYGGTMVRCITRQDDPQVINSAQGAYMPAVFEVDEGNRG